MFQPIESVFFPMSKAVIGHMIPGILVRYPVRTVNYQDFTSAITHRAVDFEDPVTKFPDMHEDHSKAHPIMKQLQKLLGKKGHLGKMQREATLRQGYERQREDLSWRGQTATPGPRTAVPPPNLG